MKSGTKSNYGAVNNDEANEKGTDKLRIEQDLDGENEALLLSEDTTSEVSFVKLLFPLGFIGLIDAISFMIVTPSLVFYVIDTMGGTKEIYGMILSAFSFASFVFKPVLGHWCDQNGSKFRAPYFTSISAAAIGGLLYFLASVFAVSSSSTVQTIDDHNEAASTGSVSNTSVVGLVLIFLGRFLGGMGAANSTLGFTYIAEVIPHTQMTKASSVLSTVRIFGMAFAPLFSVILAKIKFTINIGTMAIDITHLNSVGLILFFGNLLTLVVVYYTFHEPSEAKPTKASVENSGTNDDNNNEVSTKQDDGWEFWKNVLTLDILIPIFIIFSLNANFQLIETALAPASFDALGWGPVQVSSVFSFNAILMFAVILATFQLSAIGIKDITFLIVGESISAIGYLFLYLLWKQEAATWQFLLPLLLGISCFPLLGAPSRSIFTELVDAQPTLRTRQGTMQALMSMSASVAGFVAPGFIATYVLRSPSDVSASADRREFTPWAILAPFFSFLSLLGVLWLSRKQKVIVEEPTGEKLKEVLNVFEDQDESPPTTDLEVSDSISPCKELSRKVGEVICSQQFKPRVVAYRKESTTLMGIHQISFMEHQPSIANTSIRKNAIESQRSLRQTTRF